MPASGMYNKARMPRSYLMSRPLTIFLQIAALFFILKGYTGENPAMYVIAAFCLIPSAIAVRKRMAARDSQRR